jgi:N-methylhydantoinase B/alanine racemase
LKSRVIQVQQHPKGVSLGIGYGQPIVSDQTMRTAVIPIGFSDGLNHAPPLGDVLVCGQRAPVLGRRSIEFSLLDVSNIPGVEVGSEVVLLGEQGGDEIKPREIADCVGLPTMELLPRIAHNTRRIYLQ